MKKFYVHLNGLWSIDFGGIEANSKEAAIEEAMELMDMESGPIELEHIEQFAEEGDGCGPGPGDMPILDEFYLKILEAKDKKDAQRYRKAAEEV